MNNVIWTLPGAIDFARKLEQLVSNKYHVGITGSVLYTGGSDKDLDVVIYPHHTKGWLKGQWREGEIRSVINQMGLTLIRECKNNYDRKRVYETATGDGRRVDVFFLK